MVRTRSAVSKQAKHKSQEHGFEHTSIVDLAGAGINSLEQLIDLIVGHLLAEIRQD